MNLKKEWKKRLTAKRFRDTSSTNVAKGWNPFDSDYGRVSMSAPFRRMQDKAQVFPLEPNDFVRTRLTHSIEVSGVGRSLGVRLENYLLENNFLNPNKKGHIPSILATACLVHDIGNPPFGHFGEDCFKNFFKNKAKYWVGFTEAEKNDFINFDGNVQGLRTLLRLGLASDEYSFNLTFPTIATIIKYPKCSLTGNQGSKKGISYKKFGYYQCDKEKYKEIDTTLNLKGERHPLCFLLEAADDVCYSVSDIEDGFKKGTINTNILKKTLKDNFKKDPLCVKLYKKIKFLESKYSIIKNNEDLIAQDTRVFAHSEMINAAIETFMNNHNSIMVGTYKKELIADSSASVLREFFDAIARINFNSDGVVTRELAGEEVLCYLLERFYKAVVSRDRDNPKTTEGKLYGLISYLFKSVMDKTDYPNKDYLRILLLVDYISGMTDTYALTMYKQLKGLV